MVQRLRLRYAKRGRLRFTSHRDFARAFERALRRAQVPMAYSAGFSPHPRISWVGASPTGVASEAEYVEIGLAREVEPETLRASLDAALPPGLDIVEVVEVPAQGAGSLADRMEVSRWRIALPGVDTDTARTALATFLGRDEVGIERMTKSGRRTVDVRGPVLRADVSEETPADGADDPSARADVATGTPHAILTMVVRQVTPTVRPDDLVLALRDVAGLALSGPAIAVREAQGPLDDDGTIGDPLAADRTRSAAHPPISGS
ncbi:TIGR03936 family radical SAM-associated protein [Jatrophihabitans fulvus]